jgi:capsular polysaccharide biosynthesis protein
MGRFSAVVRSARWVLVVGIVVGALIGLVLDIGLDRSSVSSGAQLEVVDATGAPPGSDAAQTESSYIANQMTTYAQLATSDDVLEPAAAAAGTTAAALGPETFVTADSSSPQIGIVVRATSPAAATAGAKAMADTLTAAITRLETRPGQPQMVRVTVASPPSVPAARFVPPWGALTAAGAVAGALVVLLGAAAWASRYPQRGWRLFSRWLFRTPEGAQSAREY